MIVEQLKNKIEGQGTRSAYEKALKAYKLELLDNIKNNYYYNGEDLKTFDFNTLRKLALNGAEDWQNYSWGGCSLVYNYDILKANFPASIVKKYENSDSIRGIHLLDIQASRLSKAFSTLWAEIRRA